MAQFSIKPDNARRTVAEEEGFIRELGGLAEEIRHISNSLGFRITSSANLQSRLKCAADRTRVCQDGMSGMKSALTDSLNLYIRTENTILGNGTIQLTLDSKDMPGVGREVTVAEREDSEEGTWWDVAGPYIGELGVVGDIISLAGDFVTGDFETGAIWGDLAKNGWDTGWDIGDVVKTCKEDTSVRWWKEALGINSDSFLKSIRNANLTKGQKLKHGFDKGIKGTLRNFKTAKGAIKEIGGILLSGITNAYGNYEEFQRGDISADRAVVETVTETAVDWGKDLLIGAGVAAGFAAAGVAAPAVVVGAAAVGISMAADWVCEKVCGKNVTELVSDAIVDVGYKVKEGVTALWSDITSGIGAAFAW